MVFTLLIFRVIQWSTFSETRFHCISLQLSVSQTSLFDDSVRLFPDYYVLTHDFVSAAG